MSKIIKHIKRVSISGYKLFTDDDFNEVAIIHCGKLLPTHRHARLSSRCPPGSVGGIGKGQYQHIGKNVVSAHPYRKCRSLPIGNEVSAMNEWHFLCYIPSFNTGCCYPIFSWCCPILVIWMKWCIGLNLGLKCLHRSAYCLLWMKRRLLIQKNNRQTIRSVIYMYQQIYKMFIIICRILNHYNDWLRQVGEVYSCRSY